MKLPALVACVLSATAFAGDSPLGLTADKPAEGRFVETDRGFMVPYQTTIPGTGIEFHMEPIPGGEINLGVRRYRIDPFWMGRYEITWREYKEFMGLYETFKRFQLTGQRTVTEENQIDAITAPTPLYEPTHTFEYGEEPRQPAVTVTQYSAKQYTKWLAGITGLQHRLPSEAEWEHACRARAATAYHFGSDPRQLGKYAWYAANVPDKGTELVGQKLPNAWGLHDMHGNAAEWVLDGADSDNDPGTPSNRLLNAATDWVRPTAPDRRKVCGGSWELSAEQCTCTSRLISNDTEWKERDPNLPLSPWWLTSDPARGVGFRIIRPHREISRDDMEDYWKIDHECIGYDVGDRMDEGRGAFGLVDRDLPEAIRALNASR